MPVVHVHLLEGRTAEQKQALVRAITDALVTAADAEREAVTVILHEQAADAWAKGGELLADRRASER